jgi:MFS family permease
MSANPYAPPAAEVADVVQGEATPALWNPNAAANWSLLFSPIFGALLHMKNWQALGEPEKTDSSKRWAITVLVVFVVLALLGGLLPNEKAIDAVSRVIPIALLFGWYAASARHQTAYVKARFGQSYRRRGWLKPLLFAVLGMVGFVVALGLVGALLGLLFSRA